MSSPLPPDQWPYQPDFDADEDTGPVHVVLPEDFRASYAATQQAGYPIEHHRFGPAPETSEPLTAPETVAAQWPPPYQSPAGAEPFVDRYARPLTVDPRALPVKRKGLRHGPLLAGVAAVLVAGVAVWLLWPTSGAVESDGGGAKQPTSEPTSDQKKLLALLPAGYSSPACEQAEIPAAALARVECTKNSDAGGPLTATYTLYRDEAALSSAFDAVVGDAGAVVCPGNIQSPGPWRRNATPQQVAGTLVCGVRGDVPTVAWTNDAELLLSSVEGARSGPGLDQLYAWWSKHS